MNQFAFVLEGEGEGEGEGVRVGEFDYKICEER
jgi:hypothetical protein